jgi:hypothetical protein
MASSILILSSCTKLKAPGARGGAVPAAQLYAGEQHRRLMAGIQQFRASCSAFEIELRIVSAAHGLLAPSRRLVPYERSFSDLTVAQVERRGRALSLPERCADLLGRPRALSLLLLSDSYLRAAGLGPGLSLGAPTIAFAGSASARRLAALSGLRILRAGPEEARRFSCGLVGLKGEMAARLLAAIAARPALVEELADPASQPPPLRPSAVPA